MGAFENGVEINFEIAVIQVFWNVNKPGGEEIKYWRLSFQELKINLHHFV